MSLNLSAIAEIIQHSVVRFFEDCNDPDLPTLIIAYTNKVQLLPMYGDPYKLLDSLKTFTATNPKIIVAGIAVEAYMATHPASDKEKALSEFEKRGGVDRNTAVDSVAINLWERGTSDQYFAACEIDKADNSFQGSWIESYEGTSGNMPDVEIFT